MIVVSAELDKDSLIKAEFGSVVKNLAALAGDLNSVPKSHVGWFKMSCNISYKRNNALLWPLQALHSHVHTHTQTHRS